MEVFLRSEMIKKLIASALLLIFVASYVLAQTPSGGYSSPASSTGAGVSSLNALTGALSLTSTGHTVTITPSGSTINLETAGGCTSAGTNTLQKSNGSGGCVSSSVTDNGTTVAATEAYSSTIGFENTTVTAAEQYLQFGRTGIGIPVPFYRPTNTNTAIAFDLSPNGAATDFSANTGVVWADLCSIDCTGAGVVNYETLRIGKFSSATQSGAVHLSAAQGGTGVVRSMILQLNGGGVGIGALPASGAILSSTGFAFNGNGAASVPSALFSGTVFTGGSGTTTFPNLYANYGTAPTTWSTSGTIFGMNAPTGFGGNFLDAHVNGGGSVWAVGSGGSMNMSGGINAASLVVTGNVQSGASQIFLFTGRSRIASGADGRINLANNANTGFTQLTFGLETTSFPAFTVSGTNLNTVRGDGSAGGTLTAGNIAAIQSCGTTTTCSHTAIATNAIIVFGTVALAGGTATITGISPAFTSSTSYVCTATDATAAAATKVANVSGSSFTITGTTTDTIGYHCIGN
jgi:hypothetical protein